MIPPPLRGENHKERREGSFFNSLLAGVERRLRSQRPIQEQCEGDRRHSLRRIGILFYRREGQQRYPTFQEGRIETMDFC